MKIRLRRPREFAQRLRSQARLQPEAVEEYLDSHTAEWEALAEADPHDAADILEELGTDAASDLLAELDPLPAAGILDEMRPEMGADLVEDLPTGRASDLITAMDADMAADLIGQMDDKEQGVPALQPPSGHRSRAAGPSTARPGLSRGADDHRRGRPPGWNNRRRGHRAPPAAPRPDRRPLLRVRGRPPPPPGGGWCPSATWCSPARGPVWTRR